MTDLTEAESMDIWRSIKAPSTWVQLTIIVFLFMLEGFVIKMLWGWYIVPLGAPSITLAHGVGIDTLLSYITYTDTRSSKPFWYRFAAAIVMSLSALLYGWVFHFFM